MVKKNLHSWEKWSTTSLKFQNKKVNLKATDDLELQVIFFQAPHDSFWILCLLLFKINLTKIQQLEFLNPLQ